MFECGGHGPGRLVVTPMLPLTIVYWIRVLPYLLLDEVGDGKAFVCYQLMAFRVCRAFPPLSRAIITFLQALVFPW
jgi:hypothetical protein